MGKKIADPDENNGLIDTQEGAWGKGGTEGGAQRTWGGLESPNS